MTGQKGLGSEGSEVWQTEAVDRFTIIGVTEDVIPIAAFRRLPASLSRRGFSELPHFVIPGLIRDLDFEKPRSGVASWGLERAD